MFEVMTAKNSCTITLNNNLTGHTERVVTGKGTKYVAYAVFCFALRQGIAARHVGYSVKSK